MDDLMRTDAYQPGGSGIGVFLGSMHERLVHRIAPGGWRLDPSTFRRLEPTPGQAPPRFTAQQLSDALAQEWQFTWDDNRGLVTTEGYFRPRAANQAGYDAFINSKDCIIIMQITRDPGHQLNAEGIESLLKRLPSGKPACVLFTLPPHPPALSKEFKYQSWTMRRQVGTETRGQRATPVFKRSVAKSDQLPALVKEVEQWCVPFPVIQSNAAGSASDKGGRNGGSSSSSNGGDSSASNEGSSASKGAGRQGRGSTGTSKGSG